MMRPGGHGPISAGPYETVRSRDGMRCAAGWSSRHENDQGLPAGRARRAPARRPVRTRRRPQQHPGTPAAEPVLRRPGRRSLGRSPPGRRQPAVRVPLRPPGVADPARVLRARGHAPLRRRLHAQRAGAREGPGLRALRGRRAALLRDQRRRHRPVVVVQPAELRRGGRARGGRRLRRRRRGRRARLQAVHRRRARLHPCERRRLPAHAAVRPGNLALRRPRRARSCWRASSARPTGATTCSSSIRARAG